MVSLVLSLILVARIDHVLIVSIDGMRPELLRGSIVEGMPGFARLLRGPHTLEARTDPEFTVTLPNHVGMVTGRLAKGPEGHGWLGNADPPSVANGGTVAAMHGSYVPSMFDVAHDRGLATSVIATKAKFGVFEQSYGADTGAPDTTGSDEGRDKVDLTKICEGEGAVAVEVLKFLRGAASSQRRSVALVHIGRLDGAGHESGWSLGEGSGYRKAAEAVDQVLDALLTVVDSDSSLAGRVAIILTTDHGGGDPLRTHTTLGAPVNFTIPLVVWNGADATPLDLYELNASTRQRPDRSANPKSASVPPIRNSDAGNLALMLLGLPAIEGSTVNAAQDLRVVAPSGTTSP